MCTTNSCTDESLAEKLRRENCDQFHILVRMHLSFVLDLNTDDDNLSEKSKLRKWGVIPFGKKSKCRGVMDGAPLTQEGICQVHQLIKFLRQETNISVEGIFRRTGSLSRQQELRSLLNQGSMLNLESGTYSVHDCASVLKGFLAELPEPLLTEAHYPAYCQIAELCGTSEKFNQESRLLESLQLLLMLLPLENRVLLKDVLNLLRLTASYESQNKMSADSLATLYTPHLLCPRKLAPEVLHVNSQTLSGILSYMIKKSEDLFLVPAKLAVDIRAYFTERDRRKLSPQRCFNESVGDNFAARTVFSFVDHERTAKENQANPTETALAQLYAYIQGLPESSKKRKLVKQFNKENGHGTPLQVMRSNVPKNKSLGDSIKKHIFQKGLMKSVRKAGFSHHRSSSEELLSAPQQNVTPRRGFFCTSCDSSSDDVSNDVSPAKKLKNLGSFIEYEAIPPDGDGKKSDEFVPNLSACNAEKAGNAYLTSTPACVPLRSCSNIVFTPEDQDRKSVSPITRSTQHMSRAMQETMMTPRSRKPVLVVSGTNINNLPKLSNQTNLMDSLREEDKSDLNAKATKETSDCEATTPQFKKSKSEGNILCRHFHAKAVSYNNSETMENESLTSTFREYLCSRSMLTASPADLSFSSRTDDYSSSDIKDLSTSKMSTSLLHCLDGNRPDTSPSCDADEFIEEKQLVLKPKQFDENGHPIVFETSF